MSTVPGLRRAWCTELGGFWSGSLRSTLGGGTLDWIFSGPLASALGGGDTRLDLFRATRIGNGRRDTRLDLFRATNRIGTGRRDTRLDLFWATRIGSGLGGLWLGLLHLFILHGSRLPQMAHQKCIYPGWHNSPSTIPERYPLNSTLAIFLDMFSHCLLQLQAQKTQILCNLRRKLQVFIHIHLRFVPQAVVDRTGLVSWKLRIRFNRAPIN